VRGGGLGPRLLEKSVVPVKAGSEVRMNVRISQPEEIFFSIKNATENAEAGRTEQTRPAAPFSELCWPVQIVYLLY